MKRKLFIDSEKNSVVSNLSTLLLLFCLGFLQNGLAETETTYEIIAEGLINPKAMVFDKNGKLYVAESGKPGKVTIPLPAAYGVAPLGDTGRISLISDGKRHDFINNLPNMGLYGGREMLGPSALALVNGEVFYAPALHATEVPKLYKIVNGKLEVFADIGDFNSKNPPPASNGDAHIGNPYDMVAVGTDIYITDGNYNRVIKVNKKAEIEVFAAYENSPVTTGIDADKDGYLYIAQFSPAPYLKGTSTIDRISPKGEIQKGYINNLTNAVDVAFSPEGDMFILQFAGQFNHEKLLYKPYTGVLHKVLKDGTTKEVLTNLVFPTMMTFDKEGYLYISNFGNQANDGQGQILKVKLGDKPAVGPKVANPSGEEWAAPPEAPNAGALYDHLKDDSGVIVKIIEDSDVMKWGYDPASISVKAGDKITFINMGKVPHTATAHNGAFDTGFLNSGESKTITIDKADDYTYYCLPHPWMKADISVSGAKQASAKHQPKAKLAREETTFSGTPPIFIALLLCAIFIALALITIFFRKKTS